MESLMAELNENIERCQSSFHQLEKKVLQDLGIPEMRSHLPAAVAALQSTHRSLRVIEDKVDKLLIISGWLSTAGKIPTDLILRKETQRGIREAEALHGGRGSIARSTKMAVISGVGTRCYMAN